MRNRRVTYQFAGGSTVPEFRENVFEQDQPFDLKTTQTFEGSPDASDCNAYGETKNPDIAARVSLINV